jgi:outer membrane protein OmpA-like peptidoglycan-associated protein
MRILITGFVVFVIWCFISAWLYNDILLPVLNKPVPVQTIPQPIDNAADSLARLKAMMPKDLTIYFEFNNARLKTDPQYDNSLMEFKTWLDKYPGAMLLITGHSDLVGTPEFNMALGLKRAQVVSKYAESKGIDSGRIRAESKGETMPAADYLNPEGRAKNRRTELTIKMQ